MKVLHLFAGAGGSHLTGQTLGWESVGSVEIDPYCQSILRQHFPTEPIHGDIRTFSAANLVGIDGVVGGFPCTDISSAGKGVGIAGEHSGLWSEFARIIGECRPKWAFIENSPILRTRGLSTVLSDLASLGYDAEWAVVAASDVGAPHWRRRMFILAFDPNADNPGQYPSAGAREGDGQSSRDNPWRVGAIGADPRVQRIGRGQPNHTRGVGSLAPCSWAPSTPASSNG